MKRFLKNIFSIATVLLLVSILLFSCQDYTDLGLELLPTEDLITIHGEVIKEDISAYTFTEEGIRTDETANSLLGSFNDPVFGKTKIDFAAQYRLIEFPVFGDNPQVDSVKLFLYYSKVYGDTVTTQKFRVYELETGLDVDADYTQEIDLKSMASTKLLGEVEYLPKISVDSASSDTVLQLISIPIDNSLGEKLMAADSLQMVSNDAFLQYFKGIYFESEPLSGTGGGILSLEATYSGSFLGSAIALYYSNDTTRLKFDGDTSFIMPYLISPFSARVNQIKHDYSGTPFYQNLDSREYEDSLIFVQASGGLKSNILIDDLSSWGDSVDIAINKAELIFHVDTLLSEVAKYPPPSQLYFTYIDTANVEQIPADYSFSPDYYGGYLNKDDYTYHFNITQHLQNIIEGKSNLGFYLTPGRVADHVNRVILKGSKSSVGIKLIITYTKFNT